MSIHLLYNQKRFFHSFCASILVWSLLLSYVVLIHYDDNQAHHRVPRSNTCTTERKKVLQWFVSRSHKCPLDQHVVEPGSHLSSGKKNQQAYGNVRKSALSDPATQRPFPACTSVFKHVDGPIYVCFSLCMQPRYGFAATYADIPCWEGLTIVNGSVCTTLVHSTFAEALWAQEHNTSLLICVSSQPTRFLWQMYKTICYIFDMVIINNIRTAT